MAEVDVFPTWFVSLRLKHFVLVLILVWSCLMFLLLRFSLDVLSAPSIVSRNFYLVLLFRGLKNRRSRLILVTLESFSLLTPSSSSLWIASQRRSFSQTAAGKSFVSRRGLP